MTSQQPRHVHMIGIGGAGMSALARLYLEQGVRVSGSDESASQEVEQLRGLGADVRVGHDAAHVGDADLVVYSSAVPAANPELEEARRGGIPALKHAQALGALVNARRGIAVAGSHGKTTTSSMIAFSLRRSGVDASFQIGGEVMDLGTSAGWGSAQWMVVEADEFDRRFLEYSPEVAVVTNVEPDHFEYYGTVGAMLGAFADFLARVRPGGSIVACGSEPRLATLLEGVTGPTIVRYGFAGAPGSTEWQWLAHDVQDVPGGSTFRVTGPDAAGVLARLQIPGRHHVLNALAAVAASHLAGVAPAQALDALAGFHGARRRFELIGEAAGVRIFTDYGHHPTEVRVNLEAARHMVSPHGRVWVVFQPHLKIRTEMLFDEFTHAFGAADVVLLNDVYSPSGREPEGPYRGSDVLVRAVRAAGHLNARHVPTMEDARRIVAEEARAGDVVITMGAGPIFQLAPQIVADLAARA